MQVDTDTALRSSLLKSAQQFLDTYHKRRIWVPEELATNIEGVAREIDTQCNRFLFTLRQQERIATLSDKQVAALSERQERFYDFINKEINGLFESVVQQISSTIEPALTNNRFSLDAGKDRAG